MLKMVKVILGGLLAAVGVMVLAALVISSGIIPLEKLSSRGAVTAEGDQPQRVELPWPELSQTEKDAALQIALADPRIQQVLDGKSYVVEAVWPKKAPFDGSGGGPPSRPFPEAWMSVSFDVAHEMDLDYPWPPDNWPRVASRPWPQHFAGPVRYLGIVVSLKEARVIGFLPDRLGGGGTYVVSSGPAIPTLSAAEKKAAKALVLADSDVQRLLEGKTVITASVGVIHRGATRLGASVSLYLDKSYWMMGFWPYSDIENQEVEGTRFYATTANALVVEMNLDTGAITSIWPDTLLVAVTGDGQPWPPPD